MPIERQYQETLPFAWKEDGRGESDRTWLQEIAETTPRFSDRWTKALIVQLAHQLNSEEEIADKLRSQCDLEQYPCFKKAVNREYVIKTLNEWKTKKFRQAVGRNFEVFVCKQNPNAFLVVSRTTAAFDVKHKLPRSDRFRPLFNVDELAALIKENNIKRLTLRTHGYGTPAVGFYENFYQEIGNLKDVAANEHFYIGYNWPSEPPLAMFFNRFEWLKGIRKNPDIYFKFTLVLIASSVIIGSLSNIGVLILKRLFNWQVFNLQPLWIGLVSFVFVFWSLAFYLLREVAYQGDRTRAIYYGIPDLAEFFSRLDRGLSKLNKCDSSDLASKLEIQDYQNFSYDRADRIATENYIPSENDRKEINTAVDGKVTSNSNPLKINIIGHSMGGFVVLNAISLLRYHFRYEAENPNKFGEHFQLDKLILASPDVPLELLRQGRNNYLRTAFNCSEQIYLMSSDRDIVLRYLSTVGNWFSEPSIPMSGLRLGNVYLTKDKLETCIRILFYCQKLKQPKVDLELFDKLNYLDCSEMKVPGNRGGVNWVKWHLNSYNGLAIDIFNFIFSFILGKMSGVDLHGGYFQPHTPSFAILNLLLASDLDKKEIEAEIKRKIENTSIRFLPSKDSITLPASDPTQNQLSSLPLSAISPTADAK